jgi:O-acetyl-ADP-ribose deacetylase (regulator of RNase III)
MALAEKRGIKTIAFPSISTGAYRYPLDKAAHVAVYEIVTMLRQSDAIEQVTIVCFDDTTFQAYSHELATFNK